MAWQPLVPTLKQASITRPSGQPFQPIRPVLTRNRTIPWPSCNCCYCREREITQPTEATRSETLEEIISLARKLRAPLSFSALRLRQVRTPPEPSCAHENNELHKNQTSQNTAWVERRRQASHCAPTQTEKSTDADGSKGVVARRTGKSLLRERARERERGTRTSKQRSGHTRRCHGTQHAQPPQHAAASNTGSPKEVKKAKSITPTRSTSNERIPQHTIRISRARQEYTHPRPPKHHHDRHQTDSKKLLRSAGGGLSGAP